MSSLEDVSMCTVSYKIIDNAEMYIDGVKQEIIPDRKPCQLVAFLATQPDMRASQVTIYKRIWPEHVQPGIVKTTVANLRSGAVDSRRYPIDTDDDGYRLVGDCNSDLAEFWELVRRARVETDYENKVDIARRALGMVRKWDQSQGKYVTFPVFKGKNWRWTQKVVDEDMAPAIAELEGLIAGRTNQPISSFEAEIREFLRSIGVEFSVFAPNFPHFPQFDHCIICASTMQRLFNRKYATLGPWMALTLAKRLQHYLDIKIGPNTRQKHGARKHHSFVRFDKEHPFVDPKALIALYGKPPAAQPPYASEGGQPQSESDFTILTLVFDVAIEMTSAEDIDRRLSLLLGRLSGLSGDLRDRLRESIISMRLRDVTEAGCTKVRIEVPREYAELIRLLYETDQLSDLGLIDVKVETLLSGDETTASDRRVDLSEDDTKATATFARAWRSATDHEALIRPWRRLRYLFSPAIRLTPLAHSIGESTDRVYAAPGIRSKIRSLLLDVGMAYGLWPLFTAALLAVILSLLKLVVPEVDVWMGVATGVLLSLSGAQACSSVVSVISCGASGIPMALSFGIIQGITFGSLTNSGVWGPFDPSIVHKDMFTTVVGGLVGLGAPQWHTKFNLLSMILMVALIAAGIAMSAGLMAQSRIAAGLTGPPTGAAGRFRRWLRQHPNIAGFLCAIPTGGCIGMIFGLTQLFGKLLHNPGAGFTAAFALIGGSAFAITVAARTGSKTRGVLFGLVHALCAVLLCLAILHAPAGLGLLVAISAACALLNSTFFTSAYMLGLAVGSVRSAIVAAIWEGAVGFSAFAIYRILNFPR